MANTFLTNEIITMETLRILENTLAASDRINRSYDDSFRFGGAVLGQTLSVRKPVRYIGRLGQAAQIEGIQEQYATITLSYQRGVDTQVSSQDLLLSIDEYSTRIIKPKIARIANMVDQDVCRLALQVPASVGTPGTTPTALDTYWGAKTKLDNFAAPQEDRSVILNPRAQQKIGNALVTQFNPQSDISSIYRKGSMGTALNADWFMDQNVYVHTVGALGASTPEVLNAGQSGASIVTDGWSTGTLNAGDVVSFEGVYAVNPESYQSTGELMQFVVTATTVDAAGTLTIPISPSMVGPGSPLQNVSALPADNADVYVFDTAAASFANITGKSAPQNLFFQRDFGTLVMVDLPEPNGVDMAKTMSSKRGRVSVRVIRDYNVLTDQWIERTDVLYGVAVLRQELACRVQG